MSHLLLYRKLMKYLIILLLASCTNQDHSKDISYGDIDKEYEQTDEGTEVKIYEGDELVAIKLHPFGGAVITKEPGFDDE